VPPDQEVKKAEKLANLPTYIGYQHQVTGSFYLIFKFVSKNELARG
jgi:hypothetical protein